MLGLDDKIAGLSDGRTLAIVTLVAVVLGLRHASDPDHLAAVTTLIASDGERRARRAAVLGLSWGAGHATSLLAFGLPIVLYRAYLPEPVQASAETAVGVLIIALAAWLLVRWRRGAFRADSNPPQHAHARPPAGRTPLQAYGIGLVHGMGGSAGVGVLLLASIRDRPLAVMALVVFAFFTAVSMTIVSTGVGATLDRAAVRRWFGVAAPALGMLSLGFGVWYALAALSLAPQGF
jgi:ABC-type nickel/cobalt efflux system permease component RcnA